MMKLSEKQHIALSRLIDGPGLLPIRQYGSLLAAGYVEKADIPKTKGYCGAMITELGRSAVEIATEEA